MGRSSLVAEIFGRHCLPAAPHPQDALSRKFAIAMTAGAALAGAPDASNALTFHPSNHSFIQLFELQ
jgi:hypothetical protein